MTKYLLLLFNFVGLLLFATFFDSEPVTVSHNFPESVKTGNEYIVEVKINKNNITGFAEFKQILPEGFSAVVIDSKKGSFSFTDREVKIIWMTLPEEKEFIVQYKITILSSAVGENWVDGSFAFLDNNQKMVVNIEKKKILVNTLLSNLDDQSDAIIQKISPSTKVIDSVSSLPLMCKRNLNYEETGSKILVEVEIKNDSVNGFAKLEEVIPEGFIATSNESHNAVFSYVDKKVKFLWMSFPFEKEFKVSYTLTPTQAIEDSIYINGFLSFTIAEVSKKFTLTPSAISSNFKKASLGANSPLASKRDSSASITSLSSLSTIENKTAAATAENTKLPEKVLETTANTLAEAAKQNAENSKSASPLGNPTEITSIPTPQTGVNFRVQICATQKPVELSYFKENFHLSDEIYAEMHQGWHKFTMNNVSSYKLARDKREELRQNEMIKGPFVAAYNGGSRITVQEALMIANQKWVR